MKHSHDRTVTKRKYQGESEARYLLELLNEGLTLDRDALIKLISALQELIKAQPKPIKKALLNGDPAQLKQLERVGAVNRVLRRYLVRPYVRLPSTLGSPVRLDWRASVTHPGFVQSRRNADVEFNAVRVAIHLAERSLIQRLKKCERDGCERWLYAKFKHKKYCSDDCYASFHRDDPQEKARRRDWARDNYQSRLELDLGSRTAAKPGGRTTTLKVKGGKNVTHKAR